MATLRSNGVKKDVFTLVAPANRCVSIIRKSVVQRARQIRTLFFHGFFWCWISGSRRNLTTVVFLFELSGTRSLRCDDFKHYRKDQPKAFKQKATEEIRGWFSRNAFISFEVSVLLKKSTALTRRTGFVVSKASLQRVFHSPHSKRLQKACTAIKRRRI